MNQLNNKMEAKNQDRKIITDKVVLTQTGKTMENWFFFLDKQGAKKLEKNKIFELISKTNSLNILSEWNQQLLTTSYVWSRGLMERGQKERGFEVSIGKTINVPIDVLYQTWDDNNKRKKWLKEKISIRKATENKSIRALWCDEKTSLSIDFYNKGENKTQVVVQHLKIENSKISSELKIFWTERLNQLKVLLEK